MNPIPNDLFHPTKLQKAAYYLLGSILMGIGFYSLAQGLAQLPF